MTAPPRLVLPRGRSLDLSRAVVMGIVNLTPDSFYAPSRRGAPEAAVEAALNMEKEGALIIDLGGESTRPGSDPVDEAEELERVVPAIQAIRQRSDVVLSVDTRKAAVAAAAMAAGADIINDITALRGDTRMLEVAVSSGAAVVLMHMQGEPKTMQHAPRYEDCAATVLAFLDQAAQAARASGLSQDRIALDPGIGFGKRLEDNLALLARLDSLAKLGYPLLVGLSRKSFVGAITGRQASERLAGSLGAACAALEAGARIFRVHDVAATVDALAVFQASRRGFCPHVESEGKLRSPA